MVSTWNALYTFFRSLFCCCFLSLSLSFLLLLFSFHQSRIWCDSKKIKKKSSRVSRWSGQKVSLQRYTLPPAPTVTHQRPSSVESMSSLKALPFLRAEPRRFFVWQWICFVWRRARDSVDGGCCIDVLRLHTEILGVLPRRPNFIRWIKGKMG